MFAIGWSLIRLALTALVLSGFAPMALPSVAAEREAARIAELSFLPAGLIDEARRLAAEIHRDPIGPAPAADALVARAQEALGAGRPARALDAFVLATRAAPESAALWLGIARSALAVDASDRQAERRLEEQASAAAINAYVHAEDEAARALALDLLGQALAARSMWRAAIRTHRASLALVDDADVRARHERLVARHGFRVIDHRVEADAASPRICLQLSQPLARHHADLADFVAVPGYPELAVEADEQQICIEGVRHGERYPIQVRAGLPAADGEQLIRPVELSVYVRDRRPSVRFLGRAYVLPRGEAATIPLVSVNTAEIQAELLRVGDRSLARVVGDGAFLGPLSEYDQRRLREQTGEQIWVGTVAVEPELNRDLTTAVPVGSLIEGLEPGVYVLTAQPTEAHDEDAIATQWFVVSDIGLSAFSGRDGLHVFVRALSTAGPMPGVALRLIARNNEVLAEAVSDAMGYARIAPGLLRGTGGQAPALLVAEESGGDYGFLDLAKTPFDLSDRGVAGRPAPRPLDVFLVTERGVYRPGERVQITALTRNLQGRAVRDVPLTLVVKRPDGVEHTRARVDDQGLGGHVLAVELPTTAMRGTWRVAAYGDPQGQALAEAPFAVEDFQPERLDFELAMPTGPVARAEPPPVTVAARFLYGAPGAGLEVTGTTVLRSVRELEGSPGFQFGLAEEQTEPRSEPIATGRTDQLGRARLYPRLPVVAPSSQPEVAEIRVEVADAGGRPVERRIARPVVPPASRLGIKPLFGEQVAQGGTAGFEVIGVGISGERVALDQVRWSLSQITRTFQWYRIDGRWDYEPIVSQEQVATGQLTVTAEGPARIEAQVDWGEYLLEVRAAEDAALPASVTFDAGWHVSPTSVDTPDLVPITLDKSTYAVGDTARIHIGSRFAGQALVLVLDDRLISMTELVVPKGGATAEIAVTDDWGVGTYIAAFLYRPMDLDAKRMPGRAIGLAWAGVDAGDRRLAVQLQAPEPARPRGPLEVALALDGLPAGAEAYVTLAAVDLGILNLTRYTPPAPDDWYLGQRQLGVELRDLYGQLIDRMQGAPGTIRSGGDALAIRLTGPPPTETLMAHFSGIQRVDAEGRAKVSLELPDFNGTVRLMAMAWSEDGVGHAIRDLVVRDRIVIEAAMPRFLAPGDESRLRLDLTQLEGEGGDAALSITSDHGHVQLDPAQVSQRVVLAPDTRVVTEVPISAPSSGDAQLSVYLKTHAGEVLRKSLTLAVRDNRPPVTERDLTPLEPGDTLTLGSKDLADLLPESREVTVSISGTLGLDLPGLVRALDRYPYGCAEQVASRALPLLYLDRLALDAGLPGAVEAAERVEDAVTALLAKQSAEGGFGAWRPGDGDLWLDAYISDFLTRAREEGYEVPAKAFEAALENLGNRLAYAGEFDGGGEDVAYALYVLARNGKAIIGDLRYYATAQLERFATPLARAQLGAALTLYGETTRADAAFDSAMARLDASDDRGGWRPDYGSELRDTAAILTLLAEVGGRPDALTALAERLAAGLALHPETSTQEQAWLLLAAHALTRGAAAPRLEVLGRPWEGPLYRRLDDAVFSLGPFSVTNGGSRPLIAVVTQKGTPRDPTPAGGVGYRITRAYYALDGQTVDPTRVAQGMRLVILLSIEADRPQAARLIVDDPLPAGFEIDNPHLLKAGDLAELNWLDLSAVPAHEEFRTDRFIAALERQAEDPARFQLAYRVRAVSPGRFAHPPASVEDMYRPAQRGWTETGEVVVQAASGRPDGGSP